MKHIFTVFLTLILVSPSLAQEEDANPTEGTSTYYFIRHAEKDRADPANKDPNLLQKGVFRAARWSYILEHVPFDAVYSSDYNRTRQTALPTAEKNNVELTIYDPRATDTDTFLEIRGVRLYWSWAIATVRPHL